MIRPQYFLAHATHVVVMDFIAFAQVTRKAFATIRESLRRLLHWEGFFAGQTGGTKTVSAGRRSAFMMPADDRDIAECGGDFGGERRRAGAAQRVFYRSRILFQGGAWGVHGLLRTQVDLGEPGRDLAASAQAVSRRGAG